MSEFSVWIDGDAPLSKFSMDEMLNKFESKQALDALYTFATTIYSEENVAFIRSYKELRETLETAASFEDLALDGNYMNVVRSDLNSFLTDFFSSRSDYELNIPDRCHNKINQIRNDVLDTKKGIDFEEVKEILDDMNKIIAKLTAENCVFSYAQYIQDIRSSIYSASLSGKTRLVIVGGGFVGGSVGSMFDRLHETFHVTLIEPKNCFEHTPAMVQAIVDPETYKENTVQYKDVIKNGTLIKGTATKILKDRVIVGEDIVVPFDFLVLSTGSSYKNQLKSEASTESYRQKKIVSQHKELKESKTILIIGGGMVGTELAPEIKGIYKDKRIILVDPNDRLIKCCHPKASELAKKYLEKAGVEIMFNKRIVSYCSLTKTYFCQDRTEIQADMAHWCTGSVPNTRVLETFPDPSILQEGTRLINVKKTLQVIGYDNIFAGGDIKNLKEQKICYHALQDALVITRNILRIELGLRKDSIGFSGSLNSNNNINNSNSKSTNNPINSYALLKKMSSNASMSNPERAMGSATSINSINIIEEKKSIRGRLRLASTTSFMIEDQSDSSNKSGDENYLFSPLSKSKSSTSLNSPGSPLGRKNRFKANVRNGEVDLMKSKSQTEISVGFHDEHALITENAHYNDNFSDKSSDDNEDSSSNHGQDNNALRREIIQALDLPLVERGTKGSPEIEGEAHRYMTTGFTVGPLSSHAIYSKVTPFDGAVNMKGSVVYGMKNCLRSLSIGIVSDERKKFEDCPESKYKAIVEGGLGRAPDLQKYRERFAKIEKRRLEQGIYDSQLQRRSSLDSLKSVGLAA